VSWIAHSPLDLGRQEALDPFELEPGFILWERFCVVAPVRHLGDRWSVQVTDLQRHFGRAPHHRLELKSRPVRGEMRLRMRRAMAADARVQPSVYMTLQHGPALALVAEPIQGETLDEGLGQAEAITLAVTLGGLLSNLHEAGVTGVRFFSEDLRRQSGRFRTRGFDHVMPGPDDPAEDVDSLLDFLLDLGGDHLGALAEPPPESARDLWHRARALRTDDADAAGEILEEPPFVGREEPMSWLLERYRDARMARPSVVLVRGARGVGKSRLLQEFGSHLSQSNEATVIEGEYLQGCSHTGGLAGAIEQLATAADQGILDADDLRRRLTRATRPFSRVLTRYAPALEELVGDAPEPPQIELEESLVRHAEVVADALGAVGTQWRPLVLLLENVEIADRGSLSVLQRVAAWGPGRHLMVVLSLRGDTPAPLDVPEVKTLDLQPLVVEDMRRLVEHVVPGALDDAEGIGRFLHDVSRGFPLAARAQMRVFEQATQDQRELALLAALRGGLVDSRWLGRVKRWAPDRREAAVEGLVAGGLMLRDDQARLRFVHDTVRELVVEEAAEEEVRRGHTELLAWLREQGSEASATQLACHWELSGCDEGESNELARMHLRGGDEMLRVYDLQRALEHFEHALRRTDDPDTRLLALEGAADSAVLAGNVEKAAAHYTQAIDNSPDPTRRVRIAARGCHALYTKSAPDQSYEVAARALASVGQPLRTTRLGKLGSILWGMLRQKADIKGLSPELRDALCGLYPSVAAVSLVRDPMDVAVTVFRAFRLAKGLRTANAASSMNFYSAIEACRGRYDDAERIYKEAEEVAREVSAEWALGVAHHMRGHLVYLPRGDYDKGQRSLDRAVRCFQRTGDLSIAALSLMFKAVYGRDREPADKVLAWLDQASAMAERHGNRLAVPEVEALRLLLEARSSKVDVAERARALSEEAQKGEAIATDRLMAHTYLTMALVEAGEADMALEEAELARGIASSLPGQPEICYEAHHAVAMSLLARPALDRRGWRLLRRSLRRLRAAGKRSRRLAVAARLVELRIAARKGQVSRARRIASEIIGGLPHHGESQLAISAHRVLAEVLQSRDVLAAREHDRIANELAEPLRLASPGQSKALPAPVGTAQPSSEHLEDDEAPDTSAPTELVDVVAAFEEVRGPLASAVHPVPILYMNAEPGLQVRALPTDVKALIVHLTLTARDASPDPGDLKITARLQTLDQEHAATTADGSAGDYVVIEAQSNAEQVEHGVVTGLSACRDLTGSLGGFLDLSQAEDTGAFCVAAYLPAAGASMEEEPRPQRTRHVHVVHPDARVRQTLVSALSQLGCSCEESHPDDTDEDALEAAPVVFLDPGTRHRFFRQERRGLLVEVVSRTSLTAADCPTLKVPFALGELETVLSDVLASSSAEARRPG
jgi:tetratricopeptide (TPR) repeat protein